MAIGIVAKLTIQEGKNEEFEAIFKEMMADVRANHQDILATIRDEQQVSDDTEAKLKDICQALLVGDSACDATTLKGYEPGATDEEVNKAIEEATKG